ncbi:MAG TPA: iron-sulfur cluster assembly protein [Vicinamibacterales bacterium]|jgi:FeS assembly SUF system protein
MKTIPLVPPADASSADRPAAEPTAVVPDPVRTEALKPKIVEAISTVYDPEIPVNIWELGLIYDIGVDAQNVASITMTLTAPGCPAAQSLPVEVAEKVKSIEGIADAKVDVVWEPAWTKDRMSEAARLQLGLW